MYMACKAKENVAAKPCAMPKGVIAEVRQRSPGLRPNTNYHIHLPSHSSHGHKAISLTLYRPLYNLSQNKLEKLRYYLNNILTKNQIRRSILLTRVPIIFISKMNRRLRLYIDYRYLNIVTVMNYNLLTLITKLLDRLYVLE